MNAICVPRRATQRSHLVCWSLSLLQAGGAGRCCRIVAMESMHAHANDGFVKSSKTRPLRAGPYTLVLTQIKL